MHRRMLFPLLLVTTTMASARDKPLPPLMLPMTTPVVTMTFEGQPLRLRVDPGATRSVELNASAARRLGLADPAFRIGRRKPERGRATIQVGKVKLREDTIDLPLDYAGRVLPLTLAWSDADHVDGADGLISPRQLPHDVVRLVARPASPNDRTTVLPMRWEGGRGLLGSLPLGRNTVDIVIDTSMATSVATAAAAAWLAEAHDGRLTGPRRDLRISRAVERPVRDVRFGRPVDMAGVRIDRVAARIFDWSGRTTIPEDTAPSDELVVTGRVESQSRWAKLTIAQDRLAACAEIGWQREPLQISLTCPALP
ncbi:hypothetical protein FHS79_000312 [Polymorphobacter multimanifer]|uniref:Aspartyl protease n=1 Tax=Polymorphobacter multimanifer TaxID=1070431 RepID=A0A841L012_9SPHN|nr:hypothetical protein [Polymorphobacter multimanifer]MBB6226159.1 hypothetical protein [Polymorphobacter multimanifer]